jgi:hypothetical protein
LDGCTRSAAAGPARVVVAADEHMSKGGDTDEQSDQNAAPLSSAGAGNGISSAVREDLERYTASCSPAGLGREAQTPAVPARMQQYGMLGR